MSCQASGAKLQAESGINTRSAIFRKTALTMEPSAPSKWSRQARMGKPCGYAPAKAMSQPNSSH